MKSVIVLVVAVVAVLVCADARPDGDHYTTKYDSVDIDAILANDRLTTNYVNCLIEKGKCNEDGQTLKNVIPDALITKCTKCNEHQKESVRKVARHLYKTRRADWDALVAKYDPDGKYQENFHSYLDEIKA